MALSAERRLVYADSSALVKLIVAEGESTALRAFLADEVVLASSRLAMVEVPRAVAAANPAEAVRADVDRILDACTLIAVTTDLLRVARRVASSFLRTLDAIHLASALRVQADELITYDRWLVKAAVEHGIAVATPGR